MLMKFEGTFFHLSLTILCLFVRVSEGRLYQEINHCNSTNGYHCRNSTAWSFCYQIGGRYFLLKTIQHCQEDHICDSTSFFPCVFQQAPASGFAMITNDSLAAFHDLFPGRVISRRGDIDRPSTSPDSTPADYFIWGHLKRGELIILPPIIPGTTLSYANSTEQSNTRYESLTTEKHIQNTSCEESTTTDVATEVIYTTMSQNGINTEMITNPEDHQSTSIDPVNTSSGSPTGLHTSSKVSTELPKPTDTPEVTDVPKPTDTTDDPEAKYSPETAQETDSQKITDVPETTDTPKPINNAQATDPPKTTDSPKPTDPPKPTDSPKVTEPPTTRKIPTTTRKHKTTSPPACSDVGYFEGPECHQYWQCIRRWWWFVPLLQTCPGEQHFNLGLKRCVPIGISDCQ